MFFKCSTLKNKNKEAHAYRCLEFPQQHDGAHKVIELLLCPYFEEVDGAYWFQIVRASVRPCVRSSKIVHARVLKFHIWIPHGKIADPYSFLVRVISLSGPFEKIRMKFCQQVI